MPQERTFADALKEARLEAGLSQSALARRAGLTGSYISVLESRRRRPPSPRVIRALCRALGIAEAPLQEAALLERSPEAVRKRLERARQERGRVRRTRDRLLTTTLFHLSHRPRVIEPMREFLDLPPGQQALLGRLLGRVRRVRDLSEAESKTADLLRETTHRDRDGLLRVLPRALAKEEGSRTAAPTQRVPPTLPAYAHLDRRGEPLFDEPVPSHLHREGRFFWRVEGQQAHPRVEEGDLVLVAPDREPRAGDLVAFRHEGREGIAIFTARDGEVHLGFPRPEIPPIRLAAARFRSEGVVLRIVRSL